MCALPFLMTKWLKIFKGEEKCILSSDNFGMVVHLRWVTTQANIKEHCYGQIDKAVSYYKCK